MNEIKIFQNAAFGEVRATVLNGEPMFCLADLCKILELSNPSAIKTRLDKEDVQLLDLHALNLSEGSTGNSMTNFVTESGFYDVILYSNSPIAKTFRKWVTSEVLPSIRKTGAYSLPQFAVPKTFAEALQLAADQAKQIEEQERQLAAAKPKVLFADTVSCSTNSILVGELVKLMAQKGVKIGQNRLFEWLRSNGYICTRNGNKNYPTQRSIEQKLLEVIERTVTKPDGSALSTFTTKVTGKGQVFFVNKFLEQAA